MAKRKSSKPAGAQAPGPAEIIERETTASLVHSPVRLCDLDNQSMRHLYCHREPEALAWSDDPENFMGRLVASMLGEGQQLPVEFFRNEQGSAILLRGYQRVSACWHIVERNLAPANFSKTMVVDAFEVVNANPQDLIVRSISDNEIRRSLSETEVFVAAQQLISAGVSAQRAARALGLSPTTFSRIHRRIVHPELQAHVADAHFGQTDLDNIVEAAAGHNRVTQVGAELDLIVSAVEDHIAKLRVRAVETGEEFDEGRDGVVKKYVRSQQVREWVEAIRAGKPLSWSDPDKAAEDKSWVCRLDSDQGVLTIGSLRKNLHKISPEELGLITFKMSRATAQAERWWKRRMAEEGLAQATARGDDESYLEFLEKHRADEAAARVRRTLALYQGEDDPAHERVTPRAEADIANQIAVPQHVSADTHASATGPDPGPEDPTAAAYDPMIDAVGVDTRRIDA